MLEVFTNFLSHIGIIGLFIAMAVKGSTFPLPSFIIILSYGYILNPTTYEMVLIAIAMSIIFTLASLVPYNIGFRLERLIREKYKRKLDMAQYWFKKYGEWSVGLTRPFTVGMYISYVAGIGKVRVWKYLILTFFGILPWSFFILYISKSFKGNIHLITDFMYEYTVPLIIVITLMASLYIFLAKKVLRSKV